MHSGDEDNLSRRRPAIIGERVQWQIKRPSHGEGATIDRWTDETPSAIIVDGSGGGGGERRKDAGHDERASLKAT